MCQLLDRKNLRGGPFDFLDDSSPPKFGHFAKIVRQKKGHDFVTSRSGRLLRGTGEEQLVPFFGAQFPQNVQTVVGLEIAVEVPTPANTKQSHKRTLNTWGEAYRKWRSEGEYN